ncbi:MAG: hypothetical protein RIS64_1569, partial [Bacteroidota bacterium]
KTIFFSIYISCNLYISLITTMNFYQVPYSENIKLKNLNKQLIISPPMKNEPLILPTTASKFITIRIKDTLQPNTTYSFNFGQSIADNNEGNPFNQFKYVFSTGDYIDSLSSVAVAERGGWSRLQLVFSGKRGLCDHV